MMFYGFLSLEKHVSAQAQKLKCLKQVIKLDYQRSDKTRSKQILSPNHFMNAFQNMFARESSTMHFQ